MLTLSNSTIALIEDVVRAEAHPLRVGEISDYDKLIDFIGEARFVLLGEASHGTHEFYRERGQITKRLIEEKKMRCSGCREPRAQLLPTSK